MNQKQAIEHELNENRRQLAAHKAKQLPANEYDLRHYYAEMARLNLVIDVYTQALAKLEDES